MANRSTIPVGQGEKNLCYGIASVPSEEGEKVFFFFSSILSCWPSLSSQTQNILTCPLRLLFFSFRGSSLSIHCLLCSSSFSFLLLLLFFFWYTTHIVGEIMKPSRLQMQAFDQNYPDMSGQQMPGKMPMPRPTHGSNLLYQNARLPKSTEQENAFKMKKFLRVEGRVNSNNKRRK